MPAYGTLVWAVVAVAVGAAAGRLAPERGRRPSAVRWWGLVPAGLALRALVEVFSVPGGIVVLLASYALLLVALWRNLAWTGTPVVAVGLGACALVASLNGGTPTSASALDAVGRHDLARPGAALAGERHVEVDRDRLVFLGDVVPVPLTRHVTSFGELVALVGLADVAFNVTARRPSRRRADPGDDEAAGPSGRTAAGGGGDEGAAGGEAAPALEGAAR